VSLCRMQDWARETGERLGILLADATPQMRPIELDNMSQRMSGPCWQCWNGRWTGSVEMIAEELGVLVGGSVYVMAGPVVNANKTSLRRSRLRHTTTLQRRQTPYSLNKLHNDRQHA